MKILPVLHIQRGQALPGCGRSSEIKDPFAILSRIADMGCKRLALLDVDAARGDGHNHPLLASLIKAFRQIHPGACLQVGGGIRSSDQAQFFLDTGATWLLVGTVLHKHPAVLEQLMARFQEHLTASIDARAGDVQITGWQGPSGWTAIQMAERLHAQGFRRLLFTDIPENLDAEPDFVTAAQVCATAKIPVFMGGSLRLKPHLAAARNVVGLHGVVVDAFCLLETPGLIDVQEQPCA